MKRLQRIVWRALVALALIHALTACAGGAPGHEETSLSWREEVQLEDGKVVEIERTEYYSVYCGPGVRCGSGRGPSTRSKIEFDLGGKRIVWEEHMAPMILQVEQNEPVVVATFASCGQYRDYSKYDRTVPAYIAFRYQQGNWRKVEVEKVRIALDANLLVNDAKFGLSTSLESKQKWNDARGLGAGYLRVYPRRNIARQCFGG